MTADAACPEVRLVAECYEAWNAKDLAGLLEAISDACIYHIHVPEDVLSFAGRHEGKSEVRRVLALIMTRFEFLAFAVDWISGTGETVRSRIVYYYRHPHTGDQLDGALRHVWRVVDGQVVQLDEYHDVARLKAFLDMVRGPGDP